MAYTPTNWATGDKISSAKMNKLEQGVADSQPALVSGTNIKTVNGQSLLGAGNLTIGGGAQYELIASVEIAEDGVNEIAVTKDSQNRDLRMKHAYAYLYIPAATNGNTTPTSVTLALNTMYQNAQGQDTDTSNYSFGAYVENACANDVKQCKIVAELERTLWATKYAVFGSNGAIPINIQARGETFAAKQMSEQIAGVYFLYGSIWRARVTTGNTSIYFPVGTKLNLYGVMGE